MKKYLILCLVLALLLSMVACTTNNNGNPQPSDKQPSNSSTTPSDEPIHPSSPNNALVAWANWTGDYSIYYGCLNNDKMSINSVKHLPIFKCESSNDLEDFNNRFGDILSLSEGYGEVPSFEEVTAGFGADFFIDNTLFLVYVTANSGSLRFALDSYSVVDRAFRADIIQTNDPEVFTEDMAGWLIVIPVSNDQLKNVRNYDAAMK